MESGEKHQRKTGVNQCEMQSRAEHERGKEGKKKKKRLGENTIAIDSIKSRQ